ncbi:MAG: acetate--CoA ligase family protein [Proteobacteria bacterium]|nr:acetate--CoA ligase family protein [Pseudomonadota bacterium]MBU4472334.1 acetate--CoA ligase family protein [Pseudomonadota bacterium]MCG2752030.1 acetate--CoA ligase family protein [Desulfobacteraceae bacterium]
MTLERILNAESVAIVGASKVDTKRGFQAIRSLLDEKYEGRIFPVNPKEKRILGLECYSKISDIKENVDLVLITTPAGTIPNVLAECGKKGVAGAVIIAGGFRETGDTGKKIEEDLIAAANQYNVRIIGPNTSGMMNLKTNLNLVGLKDAPKGNIALISQSGNMALSLFTEAKLKSRGGFSYYVGVGNELDIKFHEYLEFFRDDPDTKVILMYVEGMREGRRFLQEAYKTTLRKPIVLLKSGRSSTGQMSAGSHTGALAGMSEVANTAFKRAGIIVVEKSDNLYSVAETLASQPVIKNNKVAVLADGGGHATIAADILTDLGLSIPELTARTREKLKKLLPFTAAVRNPVDVAGGTDSDPTVFAECARIILKDPNIGGLLMVGLFGGYGIRFAESLAWKEEDAAHQLGKLIGKHNKPIVVHSLYSSVKPHALELLRYYGIPVVDSLDIACNCMGALDQRGHYLNEYHAKVNFIFNWRSKSKPEGRRIIENVKKENRRFLLETEAKRLFQIHGAPVTEDKLAVTADEAVRMAESMGGKVALKIVSKDILHKSDVGGVRLNIGTKDEIKKAFKQIVENVKAHHPDAEIKGVMVSPMAKPGVEIIVGTKLDDQFGPVIMFGLGGIMVEVLKDVSFRVLPISPRSARHMMEDIRSAPLLDGVRGKPPHDKAAVRKLLLICSEIVEAYPEIAEMDLNPVIVYEKGISVVDARIILKNKPE